ncbi:hypothetical protein DFQ26_006183 [Actinomortierella ambigua]|nr:hypothetical protein DFQ26_006183 [Actinomortierella ambigua]
MHPSQHPPELALLIAQHLTTADQKACTLVCKSWYANYVPIVWSTLRLPPPRRLRADSLVTDALARTRAAVLRKHVHHIRYLHWPLLRNPKDDNSCEDELYQIVAQECRSQLREIHASIGCQQHFDVYTALVDANPDLQALDIHVDMQTRTHDDFCFMLARLAPKSPRLQHLSLSCGKLPTSWLVQLLACLPRLKSLHLRRRWEHFSKASVPGLTCIIPTVPSDQISFQSLKRLVLEQETIDDEMVSLLNQCPNLEHLHIRYLGLIKASQEALDQLQKNLPRLRSCTLRVPRGSWMYYSIETILKALPKQSIRELNILSGPITEMVFVADHFSARLEHLTFHSTPWYDGEFKGLSIILSNCRALKSLVVQSHNPIDVRHQLLGVRPRLFHINRWACTQLEVLRIPLYLDRGDCLTDDPPRHMEDIPIFPEPPGVDAYKMDSDEMGMNIGKKKKGSIKAGKSWRDWVKTERLLMQRLGDLIHLRELDFSTECCRRGKKMNRTCLTWSLENGLVYLAGLSKLERLHRGRGRFLQELPELRWMQQHWPNLRELTCAPIPEDPPYRQWLRDHMPSLKIVTLDSTGPHSPYPPEPELSSSFKWPSEITSTWQNQ